MELNNEWNRSYALALININRRRRSTPSSLPPITTAIIIGIIITITIPSSLPFTGHHYTAYTIIIVIIIHR